MTCYATDSNPANYIVFRDSHLVADLSWTNNTAITVPMNTKIPGTFNYSIIVFDSAGATDFDYVIVTINPAPVFTKVPVPLLYILGTTGNSLTWWVVDDSPTGNYTIYQSGTVLLGIRAWYDNLDFTFTVDGLALVTYNFTIEVSDPFGNVASRTTWVTVGKTP